MTLYFITIMSNCRTLLPSFVIIYLLSPGLFARLHVREYYELSVNTAPVFAEAPAEWQPVWCWWQLGM